MCLSRSLVIDAHTHAFSPDVVASRERTSAGDSWFGQLYSQPGARLTTSDDLLTSMGEAGIAHSIVCGFPWSDAGRCREQNAYVAETVRRSGGRLSWLAAISPLAADAARDVTNAFAAGAVGVGELNADAQGFDLTRPERLRSIVEVCIAHGRPLMVHASEPLGHGYPGKGSATPDRLLTFVTAFPDLQVVAAHWGGGLPFYELMPEVRAATQNVVYDSAASTYLYRFDVFRSVLDLVGSSRVMFGSDYPVLRQDRFRRRVDALAMSEEERRDVMIGTAARLFSLDSVAPSALATLEHA